MLDIG